MPMLTKFKRVLRTKTYKTTLHPHSRPRPHKQRAIEVALSCKGFTSETKLSSLFDLAVKTDCYDGDILEIGSAWGRSTVLLGFASRKLIWSIDPHTGGRAYIERGEDQNSFDEFVENLEKYRFSYRVRVLRNTTREVAEHALMPASAKFSLVFIDGLHSHEGVETDFKFSYSRLVSSGVMIFDDYYEPSVSDYAEMIDRLVRANSIDLIKDKKSRLVWFFKL